LNDFEAKRECEAKTVFWIKKRFAEAAFSGSENMRGRDRLRAVSPTKDHKKRPPANGWPSFQAMSWS
jgi:hypothetical protein